MASWMLKSLLLAVVGCRSARIHRRADRYHVYLPPANKNLKPVAVVLNPGGLVAADLYAEHMQRWQEQAAEAGMSMWVTCLRYFGDLPLPIRLEANIDEAVATMKGSDGLPEDAPVFLAGHSMGGGVSQDVANKFYEEGKLKGYLMLASYITAEHFPPLVDFSFSVPTLTVGADLNFGAARLTRIAVAAYRQRGLDQDEYPTIVVEGMNHMQFATGFEKEDLKPEITWANAQQKVARIAVDYIARQLNVGSGDYIRSEVKRTNDAIFDPIFKAFELEGDAMFNMPNQKSAPNNDCPMGVCPTSSTWINMAQGHILGEEVLAKVTVVNNFADLNPWSFEKRDPRKPFINAKQKVQAYLMASNTESDFSSDNKFPVANSELLGKFISRQQGNLMVFGTDVGPDGDLCAEINQMAFDKAMELASPLARKRYQADGQPLVFEPTVYQTIGPLWVSSQMTFSERDDGKMGVQSVGLFTTPGDRAIDGNHYCKLMSPAKALEWIYIDGLAKKNFAIW